MAASTQVRLGRSQTEKAPGDALKRSTGEQVSEEDRVGMIIVKLGDHFPMRVADWLLAGILLSWGMGCLSVPATTWNLPAYEGLRRIAFQDTWGTFCIILGGLRMCALFINGAVRRTPHVRMAGAFLSAFLWLQLSFAMFSSSIPAIAVAIYPWLFLGDVYNVYRAAQDARLSDTRAKFRTSNRGTTVDASTSSR